MGIIKNFFAKLNSGFFYEVDTIIFLNLLNHEIDFAIKEKLEFITELNLYIRGTKHKLMITNDIDSTSHRIDREGITFHFDNKEYKSLDEFYNQHLYNLSSYFTIEDVYVDSIFLSRYKRDSK